MPTFKRRELYNAVWLEPMGPLSRRLGENSARLRAACKKMTIPLPPIDYFALLKEGIVGPRAELPPHDGPDEWSTSPKPKQSLADWVKQLHSDDFPPAARVRSAPKPKQKPAEPTSTDNAPKPLPRYITLNEWAASQFSRVPHYNTLIKWVHDGRIQPQPKKIGRAWQVRPHAEYVCD